MNKSSNVSNPQQSTQSSFNNPNFTSPNEEKQMRLTCYLAVLIESMKEERESGTFQSTLNNLLQKNNMGSFNMGDVTPPSITHSANIILSPPSDFVMNSALVSQSITPPVTPVTSKPVCSSSPAAPSPSEAASAVSSATSVSTRKKSSPSDVYPNIASIMPPTQHHQIYHEDHPRTRSRSACTNPRKRARLLQKMFTNFEMRKIS